MHRQTCQGLGHGNPGAESPGSTSDGVLEAGSAAELPLYGPGLETGPVPTDTAWNSGGSTHTPSYPVKSLRSLCAALSCRQTGRGNP